MTQCISMDMKKEQNSLREAIEEWLANPKAGTTPILAFMEIFEQHDKLLNIYSQGLTTQDKLVLDTLAQNERLELKNGSLVHKNEQLTERNKTLNQQNKRLTDRLKRLELERDLLFAAREVAFPSTKTVEGL
jgi:hypothetical protein